MALVSWMHIYYIRFCMRQVLSCGRETRICVNWPKNWQSHTYKRLEMKKMDNSMARGPYELVDNVSFGNHSDALAWLAAHYQGPLSVATGYVGLEGLDALARIAADRGEAGRLLIGAAPSSDDPARSGRRDGS